MTRQALEERAMDFLMRRDEPDWSEQDEAALQGWLDESMAHKAAFWRLRHGWRRADRLAALGPQSARRGWKPLPPWLPRIAAAVVIMLFGTLVVTMDRGLITGSPPNPAMVTYQTAVGGQRSLALADGTKIELNTRTHLRAAVSPEHREVWLDRGEAFFKVAHDPAHPFTVYAGDRRITVLGTSFSVRIDGDRVSVSVLEGRVRVEPIAGPSSAETVAPALTRGELAITHGDETLIATNAIGRVDRALAWRQGMLKFDEASLGDVVAEFNRYNTRQIAIDDPQVAAIRVGGSFRATNASGFLHLLEDAYGLKVEYSGRIVKISGQGNTDL